jgi:hypothetical protein
MANEFGVNLNIGNNQWQVVWEWMRRMQKAGYWLRASSNGTTKVVSDDPTAHAILLPTNTANTGAVASITAVDAHPYGYLMTLTGLTGLVSPTVQGGNSEGCFLTISGAATGASNGTHQCYEVLSATSAKVLVRTGTPVAGDANNGAISWQEKDPIGSQTYTLGGAAWWVCFEGMQTYQIRFTAATTGTFLRGESLTQATSGATGECVGIVWDAITSQGWMIVQPRTGAWDASHVVTGVTSGATFTPTALHVFRRQFVYTKSGASTYIGSGWYGIWRDSSSAQVAEMWTTKAAHAACTATVPPGGSTTSGNRFRNVTATGYSQYVTRCRNNSTEDGSTALVHGDGILCETGGTGTSSNGRANIAVANIMPRANRSADGTAWVIHGNTGANSMALQGWFRIDAGDDGEPELLVSFAHASAASSWISRWATDQGSYGNGNYALSQTAFTSSNNLYCWFRACTCAEGVAGAVGNAPQNTANYTALSCTMILNDLRGVTMARAWGSTFRAYSHPAVISPGFKEPLGIGDGFFGRLRWCYAIQQGAMYQTFEGRKYVCVVPYNSVSNYPGIMIGPWDQTSDPLLS